MDDYSALYSALRHPIRRRILCMLSERPRTFTEMLNVFGVESSHLTYHLESLRELVSKAEDGTYRLSAFGEAAISIMRKVEEEVERVEEVIGVVRDAYTRRRYGLPEVYDLFFTDKRVVGAVVLSRKAMAGYSVLTGPLLGWYLARRERKRYRKVFEGKEPIEILPLEEDNFEIPYNDISSVTFHEGLLTATVEFEVFKEERERLKFSFSSKQFSDVEKTVQKVLNDKLITGYK